MPLVSILIAAYNAEPWLAETLDSAARQTWPEVEVIVVDDGSTDDTLAIARRYEGARVRVIAQENRGACAARNAAFGASGGDFIQFLDADDLLAPDKIEVQMQRLTEEPAGTIASCTWARFYDGDLSSAQPVPDVNWQDYDPATEWLVASWSGRAMMPTFAWLLPRAVAQAAGPWNETLRLNQDGEYFARVVTNASRVVFCAEAVGYYRSGIAGSISKAKTPEAFASLFRAAELNVDHLLAVRDTPEARQACACLWQAFALYAYPAVPQLVRQAEARAAALGGCDHKPDGNRAFVLLRDVFGWKVAERLRHTYYNLRYR